MQLQEEATFEREKKKQLRMKRLGLFSKTVITSTIKAIAMPINGIEYMIRICYDTHCVILGLSCQMLELHR